MNTKLRENNLYKIYCYKINKNYNEHIYHILMYIFLDII